MARPSRGSDNHLNWWSHPQYFSNFVLTTLTLKQSQRFIYFIIIIFLVLLGTLHNSDIFSGFSAVARLVLLARLKNSKK